MRRKSPKIAESAADRARARAQAYARALRYLKVPEGTWRYLQVPSGTFRYRSARAYACARARARSAADSAILGLFRRIPHTQSIKKCDPGQF